MKRGLVVLDEAETPRTEFEQRLGSVRAQASEAGVDLVLVYGDVYRSDDIGYLSNICIYWNEGVLAVPVDGEIAFLTKLSARAQPWMRRTSVVDDLRSGPNLADLIVALASDRGATRLGLVDAAAWPRGLVDELEAKRDGASVQHLDGVVRRLRAVPSATDRALVAAASQAMNAAYSQVTAADHPPREIAGMADRVLRDAGFKDVLPEMYRTAGGTVSLGLLGQYRNLWLQVGRMVRPGDDDDPLVRSGRAAHRAMVEAVAAQVDEEEIVSIARSRLAELPSDVRWQVRYTNHADLLRPAAPNSSSTPSGPGALTILRFDVGSPSLGQLHLADSFLSDGDAVVRLVDAATGGR